MIPKIIHYSWIGTPIPENVQKRIDNWHKKLPDWQFKFWDESNYDFNKFDFTRKKIQNKDWGYATDELRYDVVNTYGGFYLDTDMLIKKDLSDLLKYKAVFGFMYDNNLLTSFFGSEPNNELLSFILSEYANKNNYKQLMEMTSNPFVTNLFLRRYECLKMNGTFQKFDDNIVVFPRDYFCYPSKNKNANYAEHLFDNTWGNGKKGIKGLGKSIIKKISPITYANISNIRGMKYSKQFLIR